MLQDYERKFEQLLDDQKLTKLYPDAGLKIVEKGQLFITLDGEEGPNKMKNLSRECTLPRDKRKFENRPSLGCEGQYSSRTLRY